MEPTFKTEVLKELEDLKEVKQSLQQGLRQMQEAFLHLFRSFRGATSTSRVEWARWLEAKRLTKASALLVTRATFPTLRRIAALRFGSRRRRLRRGPPSSNPSRQVVWSVRAALTQVCTLPTCHPKSSRDPARASSLTDWLRRSTLSPIFSTQSRTAPFCGDLRRFFTKDAQERVLATLTDKAVMASRRWLWRITLA
ncbi:hypothetical protein G2W53_036886 [Senna tora]|uniref:Uncharacterized protein n=1 Tax=Senna tora TaxID=362788 RepID=A0A834STE9_9FABA|nr:hypothetical protein G2W53_036886 [Senna tora]